MLPQTLLTEIETGVSSCGKPQVVRRVVESARHQARSAAGGGGVGAECEGAAGKSGNIARYGGRVARLSYEQVALAKFASCCFVRCGYFGFAG